MACSGTTDAVPPLRSKAPNPTRRRPPVRAGWRRATFSLPAAVIRNSAENTMCCFSAAIGKKTSPVTNGGLLALQGGLDNCV